MIPLIDLRGIGCLKNGVGSRSLDNTDQSSVDVKRRFGECYLSITYFFRFLVFKKTFIEASCYRFCKL